MAPEPTSLTSMDQQVMLAVSRLGAKAYGISIQDKIEELTGVAHSTGSIYAVLERLQKKGFLASREGEATAERGGRKKMYFHITGTGATALQRSLSAIDALRGGIAGEAWA